MSPKIAQDKGKKEDVEMETDDRDCQWLETTLEEYNKEQVICDKGQVKTSGIRTSTPGGVPPSTEILAAVMGEGQTSGQKKGKQQEEDGEVQWSYDNDETDPDSGDLHTVCITGHMQTFPPTPTHLPGTHSYGLRNRAELKKPPQYQMPLIQTGRGPTVYQPFGFTDLHCLKDKMPPPSEGGGPWMEKFIKQTLGHQLALGDWRALLGQQISSWEIMDIEKDAKTEGLPDVAPFAQIGRAHV